MYLFIASFLLNLFVTIVEASFAGQQMPVPMTAPGGQDNSQHAVSKPGLPPLAIVSGIGAHHAASTGLIHPREPSGSVPDVALTKHLSPSGQMYHDVTDR